MKFLSFPSDQVHFENGIGVCAVKKTLIGKFVGRIHTPFDTECREENIVYLSKAMQQFTKQVHGQDTIVH